MKYLIVMLLAFVWLKSVAYAYEGQRENSILLNDDVWIDFADKVYMRWVLAIPDLENSRGI